MIHMNGVSPTKSTNCLYRCRARVRKEECESIKSVHVAVWDILDGGSPSNPGLDIKGNLLFLFPTAVSCMMLLGIHGPRTGPFAAAEYWWRRTIRRFWRRGCSDSAVQERGSELEDRMK